MDSIRIGRVEFGNSSTLVDVEEGKNFRRVTLTRRRYVFGEPQEIGKVHIYDVDMYQELLDNAAWIVARIGEVGFEQAAKEASEQGPEGKVFGVVG